eukprot:TRINITY_DN4734_c0_g1_i1.p1 TRINITY_DN4734_c0_g1~~TRINITY_DN4734_c0_g1_i1.p1  ORF type:complete len:186 (+),score=-16.49 TRINITY_DN4734_c0_g1_i1:141-698(+)
MVCGQAMRNISAAFPGLQVTVGFKVQVTTSFQIIARLKFTQQLQVMTNFQAILDPLTIKYLMLTINLQVIADFQVTAGFQVAAGLVITPGQGTSLEYFSQHEKQQQSQQMQQSRDLMSLVTLILLNIVKSLQVSCIYHQALRNIQAGFQGFQVTVGFKLQATADYRFQLASKLLQGLSFLNDCKQ